ncbi:MAG TPA: aldose epimerase family protein [Verrucomicrobiae bacterium]|nr:aldose epimerase family protein [Verrucomicrobiae bacterium]
MKKIIQLITVTSLGLVAAYLTGCETMNNTPKGTITKAEFGHTPGGKAVELYTLRNSHGMEATIMTYGGIVTSLKTADKNGRFGDVVLGYDNLDGYIKSTPYFGALIGRYGNRIANGKFTLDGKTYTLATNNPPNTLHGGLRGFDKVVWTARPLPTAHGPSLILAYVSPGGEEGFPGTLSVTAVYSLTENNELRIDFSATTSAKTVVNLTHHSYFNLRGSGDILNHIVTINADNFTPVDSTLIPTGELRPVAGTPFDFTTIHTVGERIGATDEQLKFGGGYDHNWVLNKQGDELSQAATVHEMSSGRTMEVWTTSPGVQFYSGNFLDGTLTGKGGWTYQFRNGLCFEPQHFPDSPNHPAFPTTELNPGETYHNTIIYKFSAQK